MEGGKKSGSSFTYDLFGAKDSSAPASSSAIFGSIFAPPSRNSGGESLHLSETEKKNGSGSQDWSGKNAASGGQEQNRSTTKKEMSSYFQEEKVQPFHYSSSIYYGGQDVYAQPQSTQNPSSTTFNKDVGEDDSGSASRGNWWQGSLYY
ncbi:uncharacterized protein LOC105161583 isoform X2 [Sesamum indicum]|uniref:Uncharacterized protein LOC105161583 isoform X2 n=1 Tax=Sesamum indicum TaxID=4182 RepID=A0A6I9TAG6_SESIN|nr:uncharacterized protein LOC105161583 isoform X2 [Sesamum indicum]